MKVLEIKDITSEENYIYYRRTFSAIATIQFLQKVIEFPFQFIVETEPTGRKQITVTITESIDYPLLPVVRALKQKITRIESEGYLR